MRFNQSRSPKWLHLGEHGLTEDKVFAPLATLFNPKDFEIVCEALPEHWKNVLRDPCTRTNSALVRPDDKAFFEEFTP